MLSFLSLSFQLLTQSLQGTPLATSTSGCGGYLLPWCSVVAVLVTVRCTFLLSLLACEFGSSCRVPLTDNLTSDNDVVLPTMANFSMLAAALMHGECGGLDEQVYDVVLPLCSHGYLRVDRQTEKRSHPVTFQQKKRTRSKKTSTHRWETNKVDLVKAWEAATVSTTICASDPASQGKGRSGNEKENAER